MILFAASLLSPDAGLIVWIGITFLALLLLLRRFAWGPITTALNGTRINDCSVYGTG